MNALHQHRSIRHTILAIVAIVFGLVTVFAGGRVLFGGLDPGYVVFKPLLMFNTAMGVAYIAAGTAIWRGLRWSTYAAGAIVVFNLIALGTILLAYSRGSAVAVDSLKAMAFRCAAWLVVLMGLVSTRGTRVARATTHSG